MASRYVPPHILSSSNLAQPNTLSTAHAPRKSELLGFSNIHVFIDNNDISEYNYNSHNHNPQSQPQSVFTQRSLDQIPVVNHEMTTHPRAMSRLPMRVFDRSTGQHVRPIGLARSSSALEVRQSWSGHIEHAHGADHLLSGTPKSAIAVGNYLCWPDHPLPPLRPLPLDIFTLENFRLIPTRPPAPTSRLTPATKVSSLVSLSEIATRFGVKRDAIQTLNASGEKPGALKFVVLFENDNHNYGCYRRLDVFAKTNLHLLPGHELPYPDQDGGLSENEHNDAGTVLQDFDLLVLRSGAVSTASLRNEIASSSSDGSTPHSSTQSEKHPSLRGAAEASDPAPISVFHRFRSSDRPKAFRSLGLYEVVEIEFFAPESLALVKMLEQRSGGRASKADLECEWAKVKLVRQE